MVTIPFFFFLICSLLDSSVTSWILKVFPFLYSSRTALFRRSVFCPFLCSWVVWGNGVVRNSGCAVFIRLIQCPLSSTVSPRCKVWSVLMAQLSLYYLYYAPDSESSCGVLSFLRWPGFPATVSTILPVTTYTS